MGLCLLLKKANTLDQATLSCGGGGILRCFYSYENAKSYMEVVTSGEPNPVVSGFQGRCKN